MQQAVIIMLSCKQKKLETILKSNWRKSFMKWKLTYLNYWQLPQHWGLIVLSCKCSLISTFPHVWKYRRPDHYSLLWIQKEASCHWQMVRNLGTTAQILQNHLHTLSSLILQSCNRTVYSIYSYPSFSWLCFCRCSQLPYIKFQTYLFPPAILKRMIR